MATYVLVHGGWHGGWCWASVAERLRAEGHRVYAPSLTGLAERAHLIDAVTGPDTHVEDIAALIAWEDLSDIVLVGHSYGGMVISGVATGLPERIAHLVYLDAFVPTQDNMAASDMAPAARRAEIEAASRGQGHTQPSGFERWSENPQTIAWLRRMTSPHPRACFGKGVSRVDDPSFGPFQRSYIYCARHDPSPFKQFHERYKNDPRWHSHSLDCLHDAMLDRPDELAALLLGAQP